MLTAGLYDKYYPSVSKHLSHRHQITGQLASYYAASLRQQQVPIEKVVPNVDELFIIFKSALEQSNIIGCYANNVIFN